MLEIIRYQLLLPSGVARDGAEVGLYMLPGAKVQGRQYEAYKWSFLRSY